LANSEHREAASELALSGVIDGSIVNGVIDRTFVTQEGVRWIVDFKTSTHAGGGREEFLSNEVERYRKQLQRYAALMRALRPGGSIKAALYFPLLAAWRELPSRNREFSLSETSAAARRRFQCGKKRADTVHVLDARAIGELSEDRRSQTPIPNANPKNNPEIVPTFPGKSSCA